MVKMVPICDAEDVCCVSCGTCANGIRAIGMPRVNVAACSGDLPGRKHNFHRRRDRPAEFAPNSGAG